MKELTAQEAKELCGKRLTRKTKKSIMKAIKRIALLNYTYATMNIENCACWEQVNDWLSSLGYECKVNDNIMEIHWG